MLIQVVPPVLKYSIVSHSLYVVKRFLHSIFSSSEYLTPNFSDSEPERSNNRDAAHMYTKRGSRTSIQSDTVPWANGEHVRLVLVLVCVCGVCLSACRRSRNTRRALSGHCVRSCMRVFPCEFSAQDRVLQPHKQLCVERLRGRVSFSTRSAYLKSHYHRGRMWKTKRIVAPCFVKILRRFFQCDLSVSHRVFFVNTHIK